MGKFKNYPKNVWGCPECGFAPIWNHTRACPSCNIFLVDGLSEGEFFEKVKKIVPGGYEYGKLFYDSVEAGETKSGEDVEIDIIEPGYFAVITAEKVLGVFRELQQATNFFEDFIKKS